MERRLHTVGRFVPTMLDSESLEKFKETSRDGLQLMGHVLWGEYQSAIYYYENRRWHVLVGKKYPPLQFVASIPGIESAEVTSQGLARTIVLLTDEGLRVCLHELVSLFGEPVDTGKLDDAMIAQYIRNVFNV